MRICLFVHCFFPAHFHGTEAYTLGLASQLQLLGHHVTVVTTNPAGETPLAEAVIRYEYQGVPVVSIDKNLYPTNRVRDTYDQPEMFDVLDRVVAQLQPDVAHVTHLINHTATLLDVLQSRGIPTVATLTDFFGFCFTNKLEAADESLCAGPDARRTNCLACLLKLASHQERRAGPRKWIFEYPHRMQSARLLQIVCMIPGLNNGRISKAVQDIADRPVILRLRYDSIRALITPTKFLQRAYRENGFNQPMHNIAFGVNIGRGAKPARQPGRPLQIGFIGQIARHKGTDLLVEAFARLPRGSAELQVYGGVDQEPVFLQALRGAVHDDGVHFRGTFPREQMRTVLDGLDLLVIPSRWPENSPLVLLDALASHTPVIVADVAGLTEFLEPGKNGIAFERGSVNDLERALRCFLSGDLDAAAMTATTHFERTTATMTEDVLAVYRSVV